MNRFILVGFGLFFLGLTGCKGASCDGGVYTCVKTIRTVECSVRPGGQVVCRDQETCVKYGCVSTRVPGSRFSAAFQPSAGKLSELSTSTAMSWIANGDMLAAQRLGFEMSDFFSLLDGQSLPQARIQAIARVNGEGETSVEEKIGDLALAFQNQRGDIDSAYWKTCVSSGSWSTDKNSRCEKTYWPGCSPRQGASMCFTSLAQSRMTEE